METARETGNLNRKITVADSNNIIAILDMSTINSKYQTFEQDYLVGFQAVLEDLKVTVGLMGLAEAPWPEVDALMNEAEKMAVIAKVRTEGQKIGLGLYVAFGNGPWQYESEVVLQNQGGSETHVPILVPFLSSNETLLMSGNFKLGVKIEPKWNQPLKANDYLIIKGTWREVVSFSKKKDDDVATLMARISALELALEGRLVNLPANTLLGRSTGIGVVEILPQSKFLIVDSNNVITPPSPPALGSLLLGGSKGGYAGINFTSGFNNPIFMQSSTNNDSGMWNPNGWMWRYNQGNFLVQSGNASSEGSYIGLFKGLNSLPGYPSYRFPTVRTDDATLYFSVGGIYSAYMNTNGVLSAISDRNKKENFRRTDDIKILDLLLNIPTYTYNFKGSDTRIRNLGCMAQDFYSAFGLGGDTEIDEDESPTCPSKMLSASDAIGVCMSAIKGLYSLIDKIVIRVAEPD